MLQLTRPRLPKALDRLTRNSTPGLLCAIIILILTGLPGSVFPHVKPIVGIDKVVHACMYAVFAFLCLWGYREPFASNGEAYRKRALLITALIGIGYGGITELIQEYLVPTRTGDKFDFLADCIGTFVGILVFWLFFKKRK